MHPTHRARAIAAYEETIKAQTEVGFTASNIYRALHFQNEKNNLSFLPWDIQNIQQRVQMQLLKGKTPLQGLLFEFEKEKDWFYHYQTNEDGALTALFFTHQTSMELLQLYAYILVMDCTYKTNQFCSPLLQIIRTTSLNSSFFTAFCSLCYENSEYYAWVLTCLKELYTLLGLEPQSLGVVLMDKDDTL